MWKNDILQTSANESVLKKKVKIHRHKETTEYETQWHCVMKVLISGIWYSPPDPKYVLL